MKKKSPTQWRKECLITLLKQTGCLMSLFFSSKKSSEFHKKQIKNIPRSGNVFVMYQARPRLCKNIVSSLPSSILCSPGLTLQTADVVSERGAHPPNLVFLPFGKNNSERLFSESICSGWFCQIPLYPDSPCHSFPKSILERHYCFYNIFLFMLMPGIQKPVSYPAVVCKDNKPLRGSVKPTNGKHRRFCIQNIFDALLSRQRAMRYNPSWFIKGKIRIFFFLASAFLTHFNGIFLPDLVSENGKTAVYENATG